MPGLPVIPVDTRRYFQDKARKKGKRERTRAAIMDGMVEVVAELGLNRTTIKEITEQSGVSHGTFYNHFDNRDEAIRFTASTIATEIDNAIMQSVELSRRVDETFVFGTHAFLEIASERPKWGKLLVCTLEEMGGVHDESLKPLRGILKEGVESGMFRTTLTPLLIEQIGLIIVHSLSKKLTRVSGRDLVEETCGAILRLLGRTPSEAKQASKIVQKKTV